MLNVKSDNPPDIESEASLRGWLIRVIIAGTVLRLAIAAVSLGTNDVRNFDAIARDTHRLGLLETYRTNPLLNHPPLPVLWRQIAWTEDHLYWFALFAKLPAIFADAASVWLVWKIWMGRQDPRRAKLAGIAMAFSPVAVLVSGYHCNTDNVFAFLSLLAMYFVAERRSFLLAGLALGAAINVKLIPVLLIPGIYSFCRSWRDALRLTLGLAIWVIPFLPLLIKEFDAVKENMLGYKGFYSEWGVAIILHEIFDHTSNKIQMKEAMKYYQDVLGSFLIWLSVLASGLASFGLRRWNAYEIGVITYALMFILAPGFGYQYTVILVPLLLVVSLPASWAWGIFAGLFIGFAYFSRLIKLAIPLESAFIPGTAAPPGVMFGFVAWLILIATTVHLLLKRRSYSPG